MPEIRPVRPDDLHGVFAIYDEQALHGTATFDTEPVTPEERRAWFEAHQTERHPAFVAIDPGFHANDSVLGWSSLSQWSDRCAYARAAEVSVYVHADARGRGIGRGLLDRLIEHAPAHGVFVLLARIAEGNPASLRLHASAGFETVGVMRGVGCKFGRVLDVTLMQKSLDA
ncbi:MAG: N-acetyltransferase family protein [Phycisphaerales bacterium]